MLLTSSILNDFFNDDFAIRKINQTKKDESKRDVITHDDDGATLKLKVPGFNKKSINISVDSKTLIIEGKTEDDSFTKKYSVDNKFNFDLIDAKVIDGLLTLSLPYKAEVKPKKIKVN